ncbi:unnamed protein product, partial [Oikopleura dioica]
TIKASKRPLGFVIAFSFNIINRWMRLVPVILLGIWLQVAILPLFGQGLGQITSNIMGAACLADNMFSKTIFFVMAFYDEGAACLGHVWYLGCEFWYAAIFPLNAALYGVHKALGVTFTVLLSIGSISWCWYQSIIHNTTPYQQLRLPPVVEQDMANDTYMRPWARYDAYGVGILFGWLILAERKGNGFKNFVKNNKIVGYMVVIALWFLSLFLLYFTIFGFSGWCFLVDFENLWDKRIDLYYESLDPTSSIKWDYITGCSSTNDSSAAWNALHRAVWAFALGLLIFLCDSGFGFTINSFLSFTGWNIFAKTSFAFYIVHYSMIVVQQQSEQTMIIVDEYWITCTFIHLMTLTTAIAALIYISFELPMAKLWGIVFGFLQGLTAPRQQTKTGAEKKEELSEDLEKHDDDNVSSEVDEELEMSMQKVEKK